MTSRGPVWSQLRYDSGKLDPSCRMKPDSPLYFGKELTVNTTKALQVGQNKSDCPWVPEWQQNTHWKQLSLWFPIGLPFREGGGVTNCVVQRCWITLRLRLQGTFFRVICRVHCKTSGTFSLPRTPAMLKEDGRMHHPKKTLPQRAEEHTNDNQNLPLKQTEDQGPSPFAGTQSALSPTDTFHFAM